MLVSPTSMWSFDHPWRSLAVQRPDGFVIFLSLVYFSLIEYLMYNNGFLQHHCSRTLKTSALCWIYLHFLTNFQDNLKVKSKRRLKFTASVIVKGRMTFLNLSKHFITSYEISQSCSVMHTCAALREGSDVWGHTYMCKSNILVCRWHFIY